MDAERRRIGDILDTHGSLSRVLVELKNDQHYYALTGLAPVHSRIEQHRRSIADYFSHLSQMIVDPQQAARLQQLKIIVDRWMAEWAQSSSLPGMTSAALFETSETDFAPINALMNEFGDRERQLSQDAGAIMTRRRQVFFTIVSSIALFGVVIVAFVVVSVKRSVLDPLTDLTAVGTAHRAGGFHGRAPDTAIRRDRRAVQLVRENGAGGADPRARAGAGTHRNARTGHGDRGIEAARRSRACRPARDAGNHSRSADDLQPRRRRAVEKSRRHRRASASSPRTRSCGGTTGAASSASRKTAR